MKKIYCLLAVAIFAVSQVPARAGFLGQPLSSPHTDTLAATSLPTGNVLTTLSAPFSYNDGTGDTLAGTVTEIVLHDTTTTGTDFLFQIKIASGSDSLVNLAIGGFKTMYQPEYVDYSTSAPPGYAAGTVVPTTAVQSGSTIQFNFGSGGSAGSSTDWFYIQTLASTYTPVTGTLQGSNDTFSFSDGDSLLGPSGALAPAPSPAVLACSALPVLALGMWLARRKKPKASIAA